MSIHLLMRALAVATLVGAIATTVAAQSPPAPAPTPSDPNTKVYAYQKTAPATGKSSASSASFSQMARDPDVAPHGSQKWWEEKNRWGQGEGGAN